MFCTRQNDRMTAAARDLHDAAVLERVDGHGPVLVARVAQPELSVFATAPTIHCYTEAVRERDTSRALAKAQNAEGRSERRAKPVMLRVRSVQEPLVR